MKHSSAIFRTYVQYIYCPLPVHYSGKKSGHREGVGVLFLGKIFTTEMFKVKETPMTQHITYKRNQTVPVLTERAIKFLAFCICG